MKCTNEGFYAFPNLSIETYIQKTYVLNGLENIDAMLIKPNWPIV